MIYNLPILGPLIQTFDSDWETIIKAFENVPMASHMKGFVAYRCARWLALLKNSYKPLLAGHDVLLFLKKVADPRSSYKLITSYNSNMQKLYTRLGIEGVWPAKEIEKNYLEQRLLKDQDDA